MAKSLKDFTDNELYEIMKNNETNVARELVYYCSEILRRMLEKEYEPAKYDD